DGNAKRQPAINEPQLRQVIEEDFGGHRNRGTCQKRLRREHLCDYFGEVTIVSIAVVRVRQQVVGNGLTEYCVVGGDNRDTECSEHVFGVQGFASRSHVLAVGDVLRLHQRGERSRRQNQKHIFFVRANVFLQELLDQLGDSGVQLRRVFVVVSASQNYLVATRVTRHLSGSTVYRISRLSCFSRHDEEGFIVHVGDFLALLTRHF